MGLNDPNVYCHLMPLALHPLVSKIWIVRSHRCEFGDIPKAEYRLVDGPRWLRLARMWRECIELAQRPQVKLFVSFNPFPFGLIAGQAAAWHDKRMHYGFIGTDWHLHMKGTLGRILGSIVRRGWLISAAGDHMLREMRERGLPCDRTAVLPHGVEMSRLPIADPDEADYDCIYVGRLIPLKRVDRILRAFQHVVALRPEARLCIVGDGPLRDQLTRLADRLTIGSNVHFVGSTLQVARYLARAKLFLFASEREGCPLAVLEALCAGVVPVTTPVGELPDYVQQMRNGLLVNGDEAAFGRAICELLTDERLLAELRRGALESRTHLTFDAAIEAWTPWLDSLCADSDVEPARGADPGFVPNDPALPWKPQ